MPAAERLPGVMAIEPFWVEMCCYIRVNHFYGPGPALGYLKPLFRKTSLTGSTACYDETLRIAEDYNLVLPLLYASRQMQVYSPSVCFYRKHSSSITHRFNETTLAAHKATEVRINATIPRYDQSV